MDLSAIAAGQDFISFVLGLVIAAVPLYRFFEKNQLVPKQLQKEIQDIINKAEKLENGYTTDEAQELGELIIKAVADYNEALAKAANK